MSTKIENGAIVLDDKTAKTLQTKLEVLKNHYQGIDVNLSSELRRACEEDLLRLRFQIRSDGVLLRRKLRYHGVLLAKYKQRPRWWPKRKSSAEAVHQSDIYMKEIQALELEITQRYCEIKVLRCTRQCLVAALKRH